ncbi:porin family protein [Oxalobacteraceae bacterium A2-2]
MRHPLLTLALCCAAGSALAAGDEPGAYVSVHAGRASVSSDYADNSNDITLGAAAGYQYNRNVGVEVYTRSLSVDPFRGVLANAGYYPDQHYGIALVATAPLDEHFSFYGRAGIGSTRMKGTRSTLEDKNEADGSAGVGLGYAFNRNWSAQLETLYLTKSKVTLVSAGVRLSF